MLFKGCKISMWFSIEQIKYDTSCVILTTYSENQKSPKLMIEYLHGFEIFWKILL